MLTEKRVDEFLKELASASPAPGGGSTAALAGALGAALTSMVCNLTIGRKKYAAVQPAMESALKESDALLREFIALVDEDTEAFNAVMAAMSLPKGTDEEKKKRSDAIQREMARATAIPLKVMEMCERTLAFTATAAEHGNVNSVSDAGVGAAMLHAACRGAHLNVQINLRSLTDAGVVRETASRAGAVSRRVEELYGAIMKRITTSLSPENS